MARKRRFEVLLVIEGTSNERAHKAANAAFAAAEKAEGCEVIAAIAKERLPSGTPAYSDWADWQEESDVAISVTYDP